MSGRSRSVTELSRETPGVYIRVAQHTERLSVLPTLKAGSIVHSAISITVTQQQLHTRTRQQQATALTRCTDALASVLAEARESFATLTLALPAPEAFAITMAAHALSCAKASHHVITLTVAIAQDSRPWPRLAVDGWIQYVGHSAEACAVTHARLPAFFHEDVGIAELEAVVGTRKRPAHMITANDVKRCANVFAEISTGSCGSAIIFDTCSSSTTRSATRAEIERALATCVNVKSVRAFRGNSQETAALTVLWR